MSVAGAPVTVASPPTGEVTFLFTDIEGSTAAWDVHHDAMAVAQAEHDTIVRAVLQQFGGHVFATGGDGVAVAFTEARDGIMAAVEIQRSLGRHVWPPPLRIAVRMGLNTGTAVERDGDYFGPAVIKAARLMSLVGGGRICVSSATIAAGRDHLPSDVSVVPAGTVQLKGLGAPEPAWLVIAPGLDEPGDPIGRAPLQPNGPPGTSTDLLGRRRELDRLRQSITEHRVVTLVGIGGIGKTRLAQAVAASVSAAFRDGIGWVELAPAGDASALLHQLAAAVGASPQVGVEPVSTVIASLTGRDVLVVLDNCEHLAGDVVALLDALLRGGVSAHFLTTSRERLGLPGEHVVALGPLDATDPSAGLAMLRALLDDSGAESGFTTSDEGHLESIVTAVGGIPLAIELAAARCRLLGVQEVSRRMDVELALLTDRRRTVERHRTLDGVIAWSFDACTPHEQRTLCRLGVFAGPFTLAAGEAVAEGTDAVDAIAELVDRSLLVRTAGRFRMLEPIRQFTTRRLDEAEARAARARHLAAMCDRLGLDHAGLAGPDEARWVGELDLDWADLRVAVRHALEADHASAATSMAVHLAGEAFARRPEAFAWIDEIGRRYGDVDGPLRAAVLGAASQAAWTTLDMARAVELGERALAAEAVAGSSFDFLPQAGAIGAYNFSGQAERAVATCRRALEESDATLSMRARSWLWSSLALSCSIAGDPDAETAARRAVECGERSGNPSTLGMALYSRALVSFLSGVEAIEFSLPLDRATTLARDVRNEWLLGMCRSLSLATMSESAAHGGLPSAADVLGDLLQAGWPTHAWTFGWRLPDLAWSAGLREVAALWLGACSASRVPRLLPDPVPAELAALSDGTSTDARLVDEFERGRAMSFAELRARTLGHA